MKRCGIVLTEPEWQLVLKALELYVQKHPTEDVARLVCDASTSIIRVMSGSLHNKQSQKAIGTEFTNTGERGGSLEPVSA